MSYEDVLHDIAKYAKAPNVKLIAVSKLQPTMKVRELISRGHRVFGENYVQEAIAKISELQDQRLEWHFVGSLQKNKVKSVVGIFDLIHSVDSVELAQKISDQSKNQNIIQKILIEVNLSNEETKGGFSEADFSHALSQISALPHLQVCGLMTMPPLFEDPEMARPYFKKLCEMQRQFGLKELSMGSSSDYKIALEEGATMIRLGTVLFGERPRKPS